MHRNFSPLPQFCFPYVFIPRSYKCYERWVLSLLFPDWKTLPFFLCIYMNTQTHTTHKVDTVYLFFISRNWDYLDSLSATTNIHIILLLIKRLFLFPCNDNNLWRTSTLIITKCIIVYPDLCNAKPWFGDYGHHGCLFTIINMTANKNKSPFFLCKTPLTGHYIIINLAHCNIIHTSVLHEYANTIINCQTWTTQFITHHRICWMFLRPSWARGTLSAF